MAETTGIAWTDATFNPWRGCIRVAPECVKCYAEQLSKRNPKTLGAWGSESGDGVRVMAAPEYWKQPLKWDAEAAKAGVRKRVLCELADVFEDWQGDIDSHRGKRLWVARNSDSAEVVIEESPGYSFEGCRPCRLDDVRRRLVSIIDQTPWLDWLVLTKRPENIRRMIQAASGGYEGGLYRQNLWLGTSAGTQQSADKFVPELLKCRDLAPVLFVSCEPMLDAVDFTPYCGGRSYRCECGFHKTENELIYLGGDDWKCADCGRRCEIGATVDWIISGVESSGKSVGRLGSFDNAAGWLDHAAEIAKLAQATQTSMFVKQLPINGKLSHDVCEWPASLQFQEFPR